MRVRGATGERPRQVGQQRHDPARIGVSCHTRSMSLSGPLAPVGDHPIVRLVGVYDADGTVLGELSYWIGARLGRAHCSLCSITHGSVRAKPEWSACRQELSIPFDTYHRDDQPDAVRAAIGGALPAVVAETTGSPSFITLLGPDALDACGGSLDAMLRALRGAATASGLTLDLGAPSAA